jgi:hypothetical protein
MNQTLAHRLHRNRRRNGFQFSINLFDDGMRHRVSAEGGDSPRRKPVFQTMTRALVQALSEGAPTLNRSHADRVSWLPDQLEKMAQETLYGESVFDRDEASRVRLRRMLGLESAGPGQPAPPAAGLPQPVSTLPRKTSTVTMGRRPARDRIGRQA